MTTTDQRAEAPEPKATKQIDKAEILQAQLSQVLTRLTEGFAANEAHFNKQDETLKKHGETLRTLTDSDVTASARMQRFELRLDAIEERQNTNSIKVRGVSASDLAQESKIADAIVRQNTLEKAILDTQGMMKAQNRLFGLDPKSVREWLFGPTMKKDVAQVAILVASLYAALKSAGVLK